MKDEIVQRIHASRKYRSVYLPTVERIVSLCLKKYGPEKAEDEARNLLHQIWGAYFGIRPDFKKLEKRFDPANLAEILSLHSSTHERLPFLKEFYEKIFAVTGSVETIIDYGCGFSPLAYASLDLAPRYRGFDIDTEEIEFLNFALSRMGSNNVSVAAGDVLSDSPQPADVVFLLKMLPVLEQQEKGAAKRVLEVQTASWIVVSYPVASISGKEKGMREFYSASFYQLLEDTDWEVTELDFPTELVFVIKK